MSMVRFATTCDFCGWRSEEYTAWPSCRECLLHCCPRCAELGSGQEHEHDVSDELYGTRAIHHESVLCRRCVEEARSMHVEEAVS